jgi:hypothetical protein
MLQQVSDLNSINFLPSGFQHLFLCAGVHRVINIAIGMSDGWT